ncbi:hypothetical protein D1115_11210 [Vibrio alfacsensis]|uniref:Uncharacterized protein n=1 Tax=Vibrio alfacsensis TaxID=1074311 RepID=A0ABN5PHF3_9VIBR|nr:hypothetical protein D1115_11210 [Vibrio alfacsensis]
MDIAVFFFLTFSWPPKGEVNSYLNLIISKSVLFLVPAYTPCIHVSKTNFATKNIQMELIFFLKKYEPRQSSI